MPDAGGHERLRTSVAVPSLDVPSGEMLTVQRSQSVGLLRLMDSNEMEPS